MRRYAWLALDQSGRFVVYPTGKDVEDFFTISLRPVRVLNQDVDDEGLGQAIADALSTSAPSDDLRSETWTAALREHDIDPRHLERKPAVSIRVEDQVASLHGWKPARGGWDGTREHRALPEASRPAEFGRAARELLAALGAVALPEVPQGPTGVSFGFKMAWIAVRGGDPRAVVGALGLAEVREVTWEEGIAEASEGLDAVFVSALTSGWVFAVNVGWLEDPSELAALSARLGAEVQFFGTHRVVEAHAWARAVDGRLVPRLEWVGEQGEAAAEGEPTEVERRLGLDRILPPDSEPPDFEHVPDEETVLQVAAAWSIDPTTLDVVPTESETGQLGRRGD